MDKALKKSLDFLFSFEQELKLETKNNSSRLTMYSAEASVEAIHKYALILDIVLVSVPWNS